MAKRKDAAWVEVDLETLTADEAIALEISKEAYRAHKAACEALPTFVAKKDATANFEKIMARDVKAGQRMIFGYNFGKVSIAIVEAEKAGKPKKMSLAEIMALNERSSLRAN